MRLNRIRLRNFRCYGEAGFEFSNGVNIITGPNGIGKTCLLEAIGYLSAARSPRTPRERELIRFGESSARIEAEFFGGGRECLLEAVINRDSRRRLSADGAPLKSPKELLGRLPSVYFEPEDLYLVRGGASARRRLMDMALCQLRPRYLSLLSVYRKLMDGKTKLLRRSERKPDFLGALPDFNLRLAEAGAGLCAFRAEYCRRLSSLAAEHHGLISGKREELSLEYKTHASDMEDTFRHMEARREAELAQGVCLIGAHKDDIAAKLNGRDIRDYGSQGQSRTAVIAIKLSERDIFTDEFGEPPLLLLDDVLSELDESRVDYILSGLGGGQAFVTCCGGISLDNIGNGKNIVL